MNFICEKSNVTYKGFRPNKITCIVHLDMSISSLSDSGMLQTSSLSSAAWHKDCPKAFSAIRIKNKLFQNKINLALTLLRKSLFSIQIIDDQDEWSECVLQGALQEAILQHLRVPP